MIGNDVIDLRDPDTAPGATHPRFDARVFAVEERARLAECPEEAPRLRWMLWAAKEAAFKLARRLDPTVVFSPSRFVVDPDAGEVRFGAVRFALALDGDEDRVHAIVTAIARGGGERPDAASTETPAVVSGLALRGADAPGAAVRELALDALATRFPRLRRGLAIGRDGRIPTLEAGGSPLPVALSLSHHGRYVAFAAAICGDS